MIKIKIVRDLIFAIIITSCNTFAILDTITLQYGVDEYYGYSDNFRNGNGAYPYLNVGTC